MTPAQVKDRSACRRAASPIWRRSAPSAIRRVYAPAADATIVMGDFNADPAEPAPARMRAAGFRSAYLEANGAEPAVTWPSGLQAPAMDTDGDPECLDYIWVRGACRVGETRLVFDRPDPEDPTLYPTDHIGIATHLEIE